MHSGQGLKNLELSPIINENQIDSRSKQIFPKRVFLKNEDSINLFQIQEENGKNKLNF